MQPAIGLPSHPRGPWRRPGGALTSSCREPLPGPVLLEVAEQVYGMAVAASKPPPERFEGVPTVGQVGD